MKTADIRMGGEYAYAQTKVMACFAPLRVRAFATGIEPDVPEGRADRWFKTVAEFTQALGEEPIVAMEQGRSNGVATVVLDDEGRWSRYGDRPLVIVVSPRNVRREWHEKSITS